MSLDERIKHIAQQVAATHTSRPADDGLAVAVAALGAKLDDLHKELHAIATRVTALEQQPDQTPPASRRPRKVTGE